MNTPKNILLIVLLALQIALIAFLYRPGQQVAATAGNLFPALTPGQLTGLTITGEQGKTLSLVKKEGWQIVPGDFPADQAKIEALIKKLAEIKASRLVSQTKSSHARLKVADGDFNRKVEVSQGEGKTTFYLGTSPSAKSIHLRLSEAKEVYQINDLAAWELGIEKESWWQSKYLSQPAKELTGFSLSNQAGTITLVNDAEKKAWQLKDSSTTSLDPKRLEPLLNAISEIGIDAYLAKDFAPKGKAVATVSYQGKEGEITLSIWPKDKPEDGNQVIKASNSPFYAKAKDYVVKAILETKLDSLLVKETGEEKAPPPGAASSELPTPPPFTPPEQ